MLQKIISFIQQNNMLSQKDKVVIGISGGADSVCLFFVLLELRKIFELELFAVHINHGIRGQESDQDEVYVTELTKREGVPLTRFKTDIKVMAKSLGLSEEEAGRKVRYELFYEECKKFGCNKIAVAHNENDQAETVLFQLFRGSGLKGLGGIAPVRNEIIRPLLGISRAEIENYLDKKQISYRTDSTNLTDAYTRNKIRLNILPYVTQEINQQAVKHIAKASGMLREAEEYIKENAEISFKRIVSHHNGQYSFDVNLFRKEHEVIQKGMLRIVLMKLVAHLKDIDATHIDMILSLLDKSVGKYVTLPNDIRAVREYDFIRIYLENQNHTFEKKGENIPITIPGDYVIDATGLKVHLKIMDIEDKNSIIPKNNCTKWFDYDRIKNTIFIRNRRSGDFMQIDALGGHKKLKDYFIDKKIPKEERNKVSLLADGSHIMWIIGDRISEYYKVSQDTTKILIVIIDGGIQDGRQD